ncbi:MAG: addiction module protein [Cyanobacteria bacterium]|nr:addiction module protein [Cyanobacteriota bacterium]
MTQKARSILRAALALPHKQRAHVATELLESLNPPVFEDEEKARREWLAEIERRARRALAEPSAGQTWEQVRERTARIITKK